MTTDNTRRASVPDDFDDGSLADETFARTMPLSSPDASDEAAPGPAPSVASSSAENRAARAAVNLELISSGVLTPEVFAWVVDGFSRVKLHRGDLQMERCFGLPSWSKRLALARDYWLRRAEQVRPGAPHGQPAAELRQSLTVFLRTASNRASLTRKGPPARFSEFEWCLWHVARILAEAGDDVPSQKTIARALSAADAGE